MSVKSATVALIGVATLTLSACVTATPYQPVVQGRASLGGFTEQKVENNRYRVTFKGNSLTSRETVEGYLLFRAAELTVQNGYDWFALAQRDTDKKTTTSVDTEPFGRYGTAAGGLTGASTVPDMAGADWTPSGAARSGMIGWTSGPSRNTKPQPRSLWLRAPSLRATSAPLTPAR